eukprot:TRINITY_DN6651_c0_g1_i1.p1 TRINITY_DN6651_c0_g1~~TRINITY_DN6651_c0_g1_i1.p1  ORF type:complete len:756 (+),score=297.80 TRINITY_DN6651_c0_g1_i1:221-2488(+)
MSNPNNNDPFFNQRKGSIHNVLSQGRLEARGLASSHDDSERASEGPSEGGGGLRNSGRRQGVPSLRNPTRPETPDQRALFNYSETQTTSRPGTAVSGPDDRPSRDFVDGPRRLNPIGRDDEGENGEPERPMTTTNTDPEWQAIKKVLIQLRSENLDSEVAKSLLDQLYAAVEHHEFSDPKYRKATLKYIAKYSDHKDPVLLLKLGRVTLKVAQGGETLLMMIKLLYKLSKNEKNDTKFHEEKLLEPVLHLNEAPPSDPELMFEVLLYSMGTLKNVSNTETTNQKELASLGGIQILSEWISLLRIRELEKAMATSVRPTSSKSSSKKSADRVTQFLVQVTVTLRNLAIYNGHKSHFLNSNAIPNLISLMDPADGNTYFQRYELMLNVSRILSKLTLFGDCRTKLLERNECLSHMLNLLKYYADHPQLIIRIAFVLGNITGTHNKARLSLVEDYRGLDLLIDLMSKYTKKLQELHGWKPSSDSESKEVPVHVVEAKKETEDVLVKVIRLIANLSITESIGVQISVRPEMKILSDLLANSSNDTGDELLLNLIGAITNLSFYSGESNVVLQNQLQISKLLVPFLIQDNEEAVIESARAFGNFSRSKPVRELMAQLKADEMAVLLLDHSNKEVVYNVCGVLMNLMADPASKHVLPAGDGVEKLLDVLNEAAEDKAAPNAVLASTVCKTLYNFSLDNGDDYFTAEQHLQLNDILLRITDPEHRLMKLASDADRENFLQVVGQFREVLQSPSGLVPLPAPK